MRSAPRLHALPPASASRPGKIRHVAPTLRPITKGRLQRAQWGAVANTKIIADHARHRAPLATASGRGRWSAKKSFLADRAGLLLPRRRHRLGLPLAIANRCGRLARASRKPFDQTLQPFDIDKGPSAQLNKDVAIELRQFIQSRFRHAEVRARIGGRHERRWQGQRFVQERRWQGQRPAQAPPPSSSGLANLATPSSKPSRLMRL